MTTKREQKEFLKAMKKKFSEPPDDDQIPMKGDLTNIHPTTAPNWYPTDLYRQREHP